MSSSVFVPKTVGANYDLPEELKALAPVRDHVNVYTNFNAYRDTAPNLCHYSGWVITRAGTAPMGGEDRPGRDARCDDLAQDRPHHAIPDADRDRDRRHPHQLQLRERQLAERGRVVAA